VVRKIAWAEEGGGDGRRWWRQGRMRVRARARARARASRRRNGTRQEERKVVCSTVGLGVVTRLKITQ